MDNATTYSLHYPVVFLLVAKILSRTFLNLHEIHSLSQNLKKKKKKKKFYKQSSSPLNIIVDFDMFIPYVLTTHQKKVEIISLTLYELFENVKLLFDLWILTN